MFGKRTESPESHKLDTLIGKETRVEGDIAATGSVRIDGEIRGKLTVSGDLMIGEKAVVEAEVSARNIIIAGEVHGAVKADGKLEILSSGRLFGDVNVASLSVEEGAILKGECHMEHPGNGPRLLPGGTEG